MSRDKGQRRLFEAGVKYLSVPIRSLARSSAPIDDGWKGDEKFLELLRLYRRRRRDRFMCH